MTKLEKYLTRLCGDIQPQLQQQLGRKDICVLSSSVAYHLLKREFPDCAPFAHVVDANVYNKRAIEMIHEVNKLLVAEAPREHIKSVTDKALEEGAKIVSCVQDSPTDGGLKGHMILLIENGRRNYILDMTIDQFSRPNHGIDLEPYWTKINYQYMNTLRFTVQAVQFESHHGMALEYIAQPPQKLMVAQQSPDWGAGAEIVERNYLK